MTPADIAQRLTALDWSNTSLQHQLAVGAAIETLRAPSNVVTLPVKPRTCWTSLHHLDGRRWTSSSGFGPGQAWQWIVETVAAEHGVSEDQITGAESDETQPFDCDDLVCIDGVPVYRIRHSTVLKDNR